MVANAHEPLHQPTACRSPRAGLQLQQEVSRPMERFEPTWSEKSEVERGVIMVAPIKILG